MVWDIGIVCSEHKHNNLFQTGRMNIYKHFKRRILCFLTLHPMKEKPPLYFVNIDND